MIRGIAVLVLLAGVACGDDEVTDEDLLEKFVQDVTGLVDGALIERCVGYTNLDELPIDVRVPRAESGVYNASRKDELLGHFRRDMNRHFGGSELKLRSHKIKIDGDRAEVKLSMLTRVGMGKADIGMQKLADGWKVSKLHLQFGGAF